MLQQPKTAPRRARFDANSCVMYVNNGSVNERVYGQVEDQPDSAIRRLRKENHQLKQSLSRRWSSRSRSSMVSHIMNETDSDEDEDDDSLFLLRETSTLHGLRDIFLSSTGPLRGLWIFILFIAVLLTLHGCYQIMLEFTFRRVVVSYFIQEAQTLTLPDVVVCPYNRFNKTYLEHYNVSYELAQYMEIAFPHLEIFSFLGEKQEEIVAKVDEYDYELELLLQRLGNISFASFLKKASLGCEAFFKDKEICENYTELMTSSGKCFRFPGKEQIQGGFGNGVTYVINLPEPIYNPGVNQMINNGIIVKLAERGKGIDNDLTFIPTGVHAIMPLLATKYDFMNDPPRYECEMDVDNTYSRVFCYDQCIIKLPTEKCNCSLATDSRPSKPDHICTAKQLYHCVFPAYEEMATDENIFKCREKCKRPCSSWQYDKQVSYATIPSRAARSFIDRQQDWEALKSTIVLEVYFSQLDYITIKHVVAMPLQSLVAQIGGQFSLWAGGSLISLCQIIIYLSRFFYSRYLRMMKGVRCKTTRKKRKPKKEKINGNGKVIAAAEEIIKKQTDRPTPPL